MAHRALVSESPEATPVGGDAGGAAVRCRLRGQLLLPVAVAPVTSTR